jgi:vancomycin resistance protein YoaR
LVLVLPVLVMLVFAGDRALQSGKVLRGVSMGGVDLSGLDRPSAEQRLKQHEARLRDQSLLLALRDARFELEPDTVGFRLPVAQLLDRAFAAGRDGAVHQQLGWWLARLRDGAALGMSGSVDGASLDVYLDDWEKEAVDDPPFEGAIAVDADKPIAKPPKPGQRVDRELTRRRVVAELSRADRSTVEIALVVRPPLRQGAAVIRALQRAQRLLAGSITLVARVPRNLDHLDDVDRGKKKRKKKRKKTKKRRSQDEADADVREVAITFEARDLAKTLRSRLSDGGEGKEPGVEVYFDAKAVDGLLEQARAELETPPVDARLVIDDGEVRIVPSKKGVVLRAANIAEALATAALTPERRGAMPLDVGAEAGFTSEAAHALGIKGLVSKFTTRYRCCEPRVKNIQLIAQMVDGVLLKPGETFSVNEYVGIRSAKKGFVPAPTIVRGKMKDTVGGGVSQFATTLFNAVFHGGYEIVERAPHSYYFKRYPMGHEATLSFPKPDLIIRNDTDAGMLIRTRARDRSITVEIWGDNGGRKVKGKVSRPLNITKPPTEYEADRRLDPSRKRVKYDGRVGWSVKVARVVQYPDGSESVQRRKVIYKPRPRIVRVHPCRIPKRKRGYTGEKCPEPERPEEPEEDEGDVERVVSSSELDEIDPEDLAARTADAYVDGE